MLFTVNWILKNMLPQLNTAQTIQNRPVGQSGAVEEGSISCKCLLTRMSGSQLFWLPWQTEAQKLFSTPTEQHKNTKNWSQSADFPYLCDKLKGSSTTWMTNTICGNVPWEKKYLASIVAIVGKLSQSRVCKCPTQCYTHSIYKNNNNNREAKSNNKVNICTVAFYVRLHTNTNTN